ncbi:MAG: nucleotidyltransferase family protein [Clostridia bacterium]|nr:nucleotidyltransferase family protein [Clostridia bacterium]
MANITEPTEQQKTASCLDTGKKLIKVLDGIINDKKADIPEGTDFSRILKLAYAHRISGMVAYCAEKYDLGKEIKEKFNQELFKTAARHTAQEREVQELSKCFDNEKIEHCFLKGLKISSLYDVPEMRFMLDIDIYVNPEKFQDAIKVMEDRGYKKISVDEKDCSLSKKPFLNVDLHRELKYDFDLGYDFYKDVYERLISKENSYEKSMTKEELYVYLLSHTAHHFATAGTGIKSVIDHYYIMKNLVPQCDENILYKYLKESGLEDFNKKFSKLTKVWFMGEESDEVTEQMADYVILSGAYGTDINYYVNGVLRMGMSENKNEYFIKRLFPPYETMCYRYPVLKKSKILLPAFWGLRILSSVTQANRIKNEANGISSVDEINKNKQEEFLKNVGL